MPVSQFPVAYSSFLRNAWQMSTLIIVHLLQRISGVKQADEEAFAP